jgi:hypothetical protein
MISIFMRVRTKEYTVDEDYGAHETADEQVELG